jgi:hypothetical protein
METGEFLLRARINAKVLDEWVEAGWLIPDQIDTDPELGCSAAATWQPAAWRAAAAVPAS